MASTRSRLDEIVESFATLEDPRSHINRRHPLPSILVIAVLAVLAGAAGPTAIARWAKFKEDLLTGLLDLPHGIPSKDAFRRVLMMLKPEAFEAAFNAWIARLRDEAVAETCVDRPIISIDGKSARRSHDANEDLGPLHVVTAWAGEYGLALGQEDRCPGRGGHDRRDGDPEGDRRGGHPRQGRLRAGPEGQPRVVAPGGPRAHRRAVGGGPGGGGGVDDDRSRARPRGGADLPADAGSRGPAGEVAVEGPEVGRRSDVAAHEGGSGEHRDPLLPQQSAGGREAVRPRGARPLVGGEHVPLDPRRDVPRGRLTNPGARVGGEHHLAVPLHPLDPQAAPGPADEPHHET